jgi:branched-chain amino acid transport system permease protein
VGRAFQAIRDRDIAAEVMGVAEFRYKALAFATSSAFAGVSGALLAGLVGRLIPESWDLILSVEIIAMILIGGAGTTLGPILGAFFVVVVPRFVEDLVQILADRDNDGNAIADLIVAVGGTDSGLVSLAAIGPGISAAQLNTLLFGALIIGFLIFEPLGLFGIWLRIRNYWKGWPFTY